jgi:hypothetical protein
VLPTAQIQQRAKSIKGFFFGAEKGLHHHELLPTLLQVFAPAKMLLILVMRFDGN